MPVKFFGHYLVEQGILEQYQLKDVYDHTYYLHRMLGELAIKRGLLTEADVERIRGLQFETDRFCGELCVEQGLLTPEQVDDLLSHQRNHHSRVGEVLVELGHLDEAALADALARFREDQARYEPGVRVLPEPLSGTPAQRVIDLFPRLTLRTGGVHARIGDAQRVQHSQCREVSLCAAFAPSGSFAIGLSCDARFGQGLLHVARGSVEPEVSPEETRRALESFLEALARQIHPVAARAQWGVLPVSGFAFDFISTRGSGLLILASGADATVRK